MQRMGLANLCAQDRMLGCQPAESRRRIRHDLTDAAGRRRRCRWSRSSGAIRPASWFRPNRISQPAATASHRPSTTRCPPQQIQQRPTRQRTTSSTMMTLQNSSRIDCDVLPSAFVTTRFAIQQNTTASNSYSRRPKNRSINRQMAIPLRRVG